MLDARTEARDRFGEPRAGADAFGGGAQACDWQRIAVYVAPTNSGRRATVERPTDAALRAGADGAGIRAAGCARARGDTSAGGARTRAITPSRGPDRDHATHRHDCARGRRGGRHCVAPGAGGIGAAMIAVPPGVRVYLACGIADMRK